MATNARRSNALTMALTVFALALFAVVTFAVIKAAGGTELSPDYSNTPNAVVPGPPAFK